MRTEDLWSGTFGAEYHVRNRVNWRERVPFWESAMQFTEAASVLEVGCGPGWNLQAIQAIAPNTELYGVEINAGAAEEARQSGFEVQNTNALGILGLHEPGSIDLVFTAGMLIHVAPADLESVMRAIVAVSGRYVLAIEYAAEQEEEVEYRGQKGALWKRPFGDLYQKLGLRLLSFGEAGGFDECIYWLLDKEQPGQAT